ELEVIENGTLTQRVTASLNLETAVPLPEDLDGHGFMIAFEPRSTSGRKRPKRQLKGWAWKPDDPKAHVTVAIFVDQKFLSKVTCSLARNNWESASTSDGDHGFRLQLPKPLRDGQRRKMEVVIADAGVLLRQGELSLEGDKITPV